LYSIYTERRQVAAQAQLCQSAPGAAHAKLARQLTTFRRNRG